MSSAYEAASEVREAIYQLATEVDLLRDRLASLVWIAALDLRGRTPMGTEQWTELDLMVNLAKPCILKSPPCPVDNAAGGA